MLLNEFIEKLDEGVYDPHIFKAVFMAGAPGAGKSTYAKKLFNGTGLKSLNVDDFYNFLRNQGKISGSPEAANDEYKYSRNKLWKREKNWLDGRLGLIIDGTGKNPEYVTEFKRKLESLGYETAMVFINTTLETSINRAEKRATEPGPDSGRVVDRGVLKHTWERVQKSLGKLQNIFGNRFFLIDNNRVQSETDYIQKSLNAWLRSPPKSPIAKAWMKQQKAEKARP